MTEKTSEMVLREFVEYVAENEELEDVEVYEGDNGLYAIHSLLADIAKKAIAEADKAKVPMVTAEEFASVHRDYLAEKRKNADKLKAFDEACAKKKEEIFEKTGNIAALAAIAGGVEIARQLAHEIFGGEE
jgi:hypothetical protein